MRPACMSCVTAERRIEELEEQVWYLKRQIGLSDDWEYDRELRERFSLQPQEAVIVKLLWARDRVVSNDLIADALDRENVRRRLGTDVNTENLVKTRICHIKAKLGKEAVETIWGRGYRLTAAGRAKIDAALAAPKAA